MQSVSQKCNIKMYHYDWEEVIDTRCMLRIRVLHLEW
jgi:hypothetical protein